MDKCHVTSCPFACSEESEIAQGYGCLPSEYEILGMALIYNKAWVCHSSDTKICSGVRSITMKDMERISLDDDWSQYVSFTKEDAELIHNEQRKRWSQIEKN